MRHYLIIIVLLPIISSCHDNAQMPKRDFKVFLPDTSKTHMPNWFYDEVINLSSELNLPRLDKGVDSLSVRIWISGMLTPKDVISFYYSNGNWYASRTFFWKSFPQIGEKGYKGGITTESMAQMIVDSANTIRITPKISFSKIVDTIRHFNILNILSQEEIPNFRDEVADGFEYTIEIATKNYYKIIRYHCPDIFAKEEINNKKVIEFLKFVSRNLTGFMSCTY